MNEHEPASPSGRSARTVARVSLAYGVAATALVWVAATLAGRPGWLGALVFLLVAGYPVALALAWIRSTGADDADDADGPRTETGSDGGSAVRARVGGRVDVLAGALGAALLVGAAWLGLRIPASAVPDGGAPEPPAPRLVVLPLIDLEGRGDRYFADGLTDELVAGLAAVEGLELRGRESAAGYVDVNRDAGELGRRLGAAAVLDGTVRAGAGLVRVSLRMIDVETGRQVWSLSEDAPRRDLFALRDSIVAGVAGALDIRPSDRTVRRLERRRTTPEALDLYLLGRFRWGSGSAGDLAEAVSYYHLAIEADSGFVPAWVSLADAYAALPRFTRFPPERSRVEGAAAARTALQLDPDAAGAHTALGEILMLYERDWAGARSHLERAAALDPGRAAPRALLCELDLSLGRLEAARAGCADALALDPQSFHPAWLLAGVERSAGDLDASVGRLADLAATFPDYEPLIGDLAVARLLAADSVGPEEGAVVGRWLALLGAGVSGDSLVDRLLGGLAAGPAGTTRASDAVETIADRFGPDPGHVAALQAIAGGTDRATALVRRTLDARAPAALRFGVFPEYASLRERDDVRRMLEEAGLPAE